MWCLWGSLSTNSTAWVPSTCLVWDSTSTAGAHHGAHPRKVEVSKSNTESGHVASLYRQPRCSHVPVSVFLLSMLILASDCLHASEGLAKLKHQAKECLCACPSSPFNGPNSAQSAVWRGLLIRVLLGPSCAWRLAQRAASGETRRERVFVPTSASLQEAMKRFMLRRAYQHRLERLMAPVFPVSLMLTVPS